MVPRPPLHGIDRTRAAATRDLADVPAIPAAAQVLLSEILFISFMRCFTVLSTRALTRRHRTLHAYLRPRVIRCGQVSECRLGLPGVRRQAHQYERSVPCRRRARRAAVARRPTEGRPTGPKETMLLCQVAAVAYEGQPTDRKRGKRSVR